MEGRDEGLQLVAALFDIVEILPGEFFRRGEAGAAGLPVPVGTDVIGDVGHVKLRGGDLQVSTRASRSRSQCKRGQKSGAGDW